MWQRKGLLLPQMDTALRGAHDLTGRAGLTRPPELNIVPAKAAHAFRRAPEILLEKKNLRGGLMDRVVSPPNSRGNPDPPPRPVPQNVDIFGDEVKMRAEGGP